VVHARRQHPNAPLTPKGRRTMVDCVIVHGWSVAATAERFQVDPKTVRKWCSRFGADGPAGLFDRSSRPHHSPTATAKARRDEVVRLRRQHRWGAGHIGHELSMATSTVQAILRREGLGRLARGDRATAKEPIKRYQRDRPGELVHVDVKKLSGIPDGGGWKTHGRGNAPTRKRASIGYRFIHTAIDDRTRAAYSEILPNEQGATAAAF
jgi:transposase